MTLKDNKKNLIKIILSNATNVSLKLIVKQYFDTYRRL